ncbi:hypothetical protein QCA50_008121 [Cerrena zonata]|uniref:Uncharacterized protein n=1 Tax=Cerrena zonata TaxID=2478898 RepID=A0AAW0G4I0_9APHY
MLVITLLAFPLLSYSLSPDLSIPSQWANTTSTLGRNDRIQQVQSVLDTLNPSFDLSDGTIHALSLEQNANLFTAVVMYDSLSSSKDNYDISKDRLSRIMTGLIPNP